MSASWPSSAGLLWGQIRHQLVMFWRTPIALFFTLMLPLMMLLLFNALFGDEVVTIEGEQWPVRQFYTGGLAAFTAVSATYTNLANTVPMRRDEGILKRWRSTPLPTSTQIGGYIGSAIIVAFVGAAVMLAVGVVFYDLAVEAARMPAALLTFLVGVSSFAALGMALAALIPNADSAPAVANATILPLAFISNVFIPIGDDAPQWMTTVGNFFPLRPFVETFQGAFNPAAPAIDWTRLGWVALWGIVGLVVAVRCFRWEPRQGGRPRRTRRRRSRSGSDAQNVPVPSA